MYIVNAADPLLAHVLVDLKLDLFCKEADLVHPAGVGHFDDEGAVVKEDGAAIF